MNNGTSFGAILKQNLSDARSFQMATAYLNQNGLVRVIDSLKRILDSDGRVSIVHGFYPLITETQAIRSLTEIEMDYESMKYGVFREANQGVEGKFHPKLYLNQARNGLWHAVVGSSNLTGGGLTSNLEVNCTLVGKDNDPVIEECKRVFSAIEMDQTLDLPTSEWIENYDCIRKLMRSNHAKFSGEPKLKEAYDRLKKLQVPSWKPETRLECVVKALQDLELENGEDSYHHLGAITPRAARLAEGRFEMKYWPEGVRQQLNLNTVHKNGESKQLFERLGGGFSKSGIYRLTEKGRQYRGKSTPER